MINKSQKKILKIHLRNDYVKDVLLNLKGKNILTRDNNPYSESYIRRVLNGSLENDDIELAILEVYAIRKQVFEIKEAAKNKILCL